MENLKKLVLGIETSCDDTSVALVKSSGEVVALKKWTNDEDHIPFGGIIPERASRNHLKNLVPLVDQVLKEYGVEGSSLKGIAVTNRPGLQGSLIVGVITAQTLGALFDVPVVGVNHLEGHMQSPWLVSEGDEVKEERYPQISLIVSGGHTQLVYIEKFGSYKILGRTKDDAVGEAIDKFSNVIGLGFPGGPKVDKAAQLGKGDVYAFPRPMIREQSYDFSFSGLKAAGVRLVEKMVLEKELSDEQKNDLSASYLTSAVDVLIYKLEKALIEYRPKVFSIVGGVSANSMLRRRALELSEKVNVPLITAEMKYCTDNGAMIALSGAKRLDLNLEINEKFETYARSLPGDFS